MGTGILATLLQLHAGGPWGVLHAAAVAVLALAWAVLAGLTAAFAVRVAGDPGLLRRTWTDLAVLPFWGTVAMGLLAVGAATRTVLPAAAPGTLPAAVVVDGVLWTAGTLLGLGTAFGFGAVLLRTRDHAPTLVHGLPIVPPMVSATTGAGLVADVGAPAGRFLLVLVTSACFAVSLVLGLLVFARAYHHHWRVAPVPLAAAASTWIPLGIVGQSTAAAQGIAGAASGLLASDAAATARDVAVGYGLVVLGLGAPLVGWAVVVTVRGFVGRMPFGPGWWALTFPVGTLSLGAHALGGATGSPVLLVLGGVLLAVLCGTWTLCATASLRALVRAGTGNRGQSAAESPRAAWRPVKRQPPTKVPSSAR
ncbi:C4-dicarboxylate ABC transporter [Phycicoccus sp. BSK3Z-2]|uniref:C4-dicarboxylate ABC transporter n=2 Tax=Phycicoccus avicenniae TaxID=2828860 RepID=A0A941I1W4_9MICO|nr:C4-dicarboxylate ABC transporter [Phycicoccus avicenniae]